MTRMWWWWLVIAVAACRDERLPDPPRDTAPGPAVATPQPVRVELGSCDTIKPFFVGAAPLRPPEGQPYIGLPGGTIGTGRYGTIGHGSSALRSRKQPVATLDAVETDPPFKADVVRQLKRSMTKVQYCYEKQLVLDGPRSTGAHEIVFEIATDGTVASPPTVSDLSNATFVTCVQDFVAKELASTAPKHPIVARARVLLDPGDCPYCPAVQTLMPNPLRADDVAECVRKMPSPIGVYVFDVRFADNLLVQDVAVHGGPDPDGCIAGLARRITRPGTARAMRCSFAFGVDAPRPDAIVKAGENRVLRHGEGEISLTDLQHFVIQQRVADAALDRRGPIQLQVEPSIAMGSVAMLVDQIEQLDAGVVFVIPHAFGGPPRFLGRTLPAAPVAPSDYQRTAKHHVSVQPNVLLVDNEPVDSWDALAVRLRELRATSDPRLEMRPGPQVRFGDFAHAVDVVVTAGFTDWQLWH